MREGLIIPINSAHKAQVHLCYKKEKNILREKNKTHNSNIHVAKRKEKKTDTENTSQKT